MEQQGGDHGGAGGAESEGGPDRDELASMRIIRRMTADSDLVGERG